jgi:hypothetical protein
MQGVFYDIFKVRRMLWPGNSPDLNAIEPCWMYLRKEATKDGPPQMREEAAFCWLRAWNHMPQEKIQAWIRRIF